MTDKQSADFWLVRRYPLALMLRYTSRLELVAFTYSGTNAPLAWEQNCSDQRGMLRS